MRNQLFFDSLLLRTPLYSFHQARNLNESEFLDDPGFRLALYLASRSLYGELSRYGFAFAALPLKLQITVRKYINRACHRSTPFGMFSSIALAHWQSHPPPSASLSEPVCTTKLDFATLDALWNKLKEEGSQCQCRLAVNNTWFNNQTDGRYIKRERKEGKQIAFSLASIKPDKLIRKLCSYCLLPRTWKEVMDFLAANTESDEQDRENFLKKLTCEQLLYPAFSPHTTGPDVLQTWAHLRDAPLISGIAEKLERANAPQASPGHILTHLQSLCAALDDSLPALGNHNHFYALSERTTLQGGLSGHYRQSLNEGLQALIRLASPAANPVLDQFKREFLNRYEDREIPLLEVLDAQLGIGYGNVDETFTHASPLEASPKSSGARAYTPQEKHNQLTGFFTGSIHPQADTTPTLVISEEDLQTLPANNADLLPPTFSVVFRPLGSAVYIENGGGASALALLGRFTHSPSVRAYAEKIISTEEKHNPGVLFAEIVHIDNLHTANIDRRPFLRKHEICLITPSAMEAGQAISPGDLVVSVTNNTVILRSLSLNQRVIPRLSSAYNFTKSALPLFRFLCDLQSQGLTTNLSFSLPALLPGRKFYPRVQYKSAILQLAEWHLQPEELRLSLSGINAEETEKPLKGKLSYQLPRHFSYRVGDNFLVIDAWKKEDRELLLNEISGKETIVLQEFPFLEETGVTNPKNQPLLAQYIAALYHEEEVYQPVGPAGQPASPHPPRMRNTKDWVYFKIYCHPLSADNIIANHLLPLTKKLAGSVQLRQCFWLRYNDPGHHLRFRVQIPPDQLGLVVQECHAVLVELSRQNLVKSFQPALYIRELTRYTPGLITAVESVFTASSSCVARWIKQSMDNEDMTGLALEEGLSCTASILHHLGFSFQQQIAFCKSRFEDFFREFDSPKADKTLWEQQLRKSGFLTGQALAYNHKKRKELIRALDNLVTKYRRIAVQLPLEKIAADIIHLHINRLHATRQRYQEMVTYFYVYRYLSAQWHKQVH